MEKLRSARRKASMEYRKNIVALNKVLDTIRVKMCDKRWSLIDHRKTTSQTLHKFKNSLRNVNKKGEPRKQKTLLMRKT